MAVELIQGKWAQFQGNDVIQYHTGDYEWLVIIFRWNDGRWSASIDYRRRSIPAEIDENGEFLRHDDEHTALQYARERIEDIQTNNPWGLYA